MTVAAIGHLPGLHHLIHACTSSLALAGSVPLAIAGKKVRTRSDRSTHHSQREGGVVLFGGTGCMQCADA